MVFAQLEPGTGPRLEASMAQQNIVIDGLDTLRLVTHLDVDDNDIDQAITALRTFR